MLSLKLKNYIWGLISWSVERVIIYLTVFFICSQNTLNLINIVHWDILFSQSLVAIFLMLNEQHNGHYWVDWNIDNSYLNFTISLIFVFLAMICIYLYKDRKVKCEHPMHASFSILYYTYREYSCFKNIHIPDTE